VVEMLVEQVVRQLEQRQQGADALRCWFHLERGEPVLIEVGLYHPNASAAHLGELVRMQMEHLRLASPVTAVRIEAPAASPIEEQQAEMFPGAARGASSGPTPLAVLVERLACRLGRESVVQPELVPDPQPECAVRYEPMIGRRRSAGAALLEEPAEEAPAVGRWRPLRMAPQPLPVEVAVAPDGQPIRCTCRGHDHRLVRTWGPERIETGWWRERPVRRDYYRVETASGCRFWLFHRLSDGRWFLHGWFE
jgi:protein ImuB